MAEALLNQELILPEISIFDLLFMGGGRLFQIVIYQATGTESLQDKPNSGQHGTSCPLLQL